MRQLVNHRDLSNYHLFLILFATLVRTREAAKWPYSDITSTLAAKGVFSFLGVIFSFLRRIDMVLRVT